MEEIIKFISEMVNVGKPNKVGKLKMKTIKKENMEMKQKRNNEKLKRKPTMNTKK